MTTLKLACSLVEQRTYSHTITKEQIISEILRNANLIRPGVHTKLLALDLTQLTFKITNHYATRAVQISPTIPDSLIAQYMSLFPEEFI